MRTHRTLAGVATAALLLLAAGCGDDDGGDDAADTTASTSTTTEATTSASEPRPDSTIGDDPGGDDATAPAPVERPADGSCVSVPVPDDGLYQVADAGTAVVQREGDRLTVGTVTPAEGWTSTVDDDDDGDDVEVEFEQGTQEVWLDVEIDDGAVNAKVCADVDDDDDDDD